MVQHQLRGSHRLIRLHKWGALIFCRWQYFPPLLPSTGLSRDSIPQLPARLFSTLPTDPLQAVNSRLQWSQEPRFKLFSRRFDSSALLERCLNRMSPAINWFLFQSVLQRELVDFRNPPVIRFVRGRCKICRGQASLSHASACHKNTKIWVIVIWFSSLVIAIKISEEVNEILSWNPTTFKKVSQKANFIATFAACRKLEALPLKIFSPANPGRFNARIIASEDIAWLH